jgi:hypothetical protein
MKKSYLIKMQVNPIHLNEWEEVLGKVEAVSVVNDRIEIVLSLMPMFIDIPSSEARFSLPKAGMKVGILKSDRGYLLRNMDSRGLVVPKLEYDGHSPCQF